MTEETWANPQLTRSALKPRTFQSRPPGRTLAHNAANSIGEVFCSPTITQACIKQQNNCTWKWKRRSVVEKGHIKLLTKLQPKHTPEKVYCTWLAIEFALILINFFVYYWTFATVFDNVTMGTNHLKQLKQAPTHLQADVGSNENCIYFSKSFFKSSRRPAGTTTCLSWS